jgi:hypothetical protein
MARSSFMLWRLRLPRWTALFLGFGALFAADAEAGQPENQAGGSAGGALEDRGTAGEVVIRAEGGKIYLSENGSGFEELSLTDTPEAAHLLRLLKETGAADSTMTVPVGGIIVAEGGAGFHGPKPAPQPQPTTTQSPAPAPTQTSTPVKGQ